MKKRFSEIDALYTMGILLAVLGHSHPSDWTTFYGTGFEKLIAFIYLFHMPLFFVIAGFTFYHSKSMEQMGFGRWIGDKAERLLVPYFLLSAAAILPKSMIEGTAGAIPIQLLYVLVRPRLGVWGHFWFIPALFAAYALFGLWRSLVNRKNEDALLVGTCLATVILYFLPIETDWLGLRDLKDNLLFFAFGMLGRRMRIGDRGNTGYWSRLCLCGGSVLLSVFLFYRFYGNRVVALLIALLMLFACWQAAESIKGNAVTKWLGSHALTIFLYSWPAQAMTMFLLQRGGATWYVISICMFLSGLFVPILMICFYDRTKRLQCRFLDLLLGEKRRKTHEK